jgi:hypothetical protein
MRGILSGPRLTWEPVATNCEETLIKLVATRVHGGRVFGFFRESETPYVVSYNTNGNRQMSLVRKAWRARR